MFGSRKQSQIDPTKLPVFVHSIQNTEVFGLVQKIWQTNERSIVQDQSNHKDLLRFVFSNPDCVTWLQRDIGRTDSTEIVLIWAGEQSVTEVYVLSEAVGSDKGDSSRIAQLLHSILSDPSTVPAQQ